MLQLGPYRPEWTITQGHGVVLAAEAHIWVHGPLAPKSWMASAAPLATKDNVDVGVISDTWYLRATLLSGP